MAFFRLESQKRPYKRLIFEMVSDLPFTHKGQKKDCSRQRKQAMQKPYGWKEFHSFIGHKVGQPETRIMSEQERNTR